ncbi:hypothetical protein VCHENC01_3391 [Vibrio harveyi]|nr:hypothetical protein VCHENC01_3391 [Vibrio harveyi]
MHGEQIGGLFFNLLKVSEFISLPLLAFTKSFTSMIARKTITIN